MANKLNDSTNDSGTKNFIVNSFRKSVNIALLFFLAYSFQLYGQVGLSDQPGQTINASAILDLKSSNKGVLVSRMDSTARKAINSPAEGLLVFDTTTISFWFYGKKDDKSTPSWREVLNGGISSTNRMVIKEDGTVELKNAATTWNDMIVSPFTTYLGNVNPPAFSTFKTNVLALIFEDKSSAGSEQQVFFSIQIPHNWKEVSTLYPHVHWSPQSAAGNTGSVVWGFEYTWVNYNATTPELFPATTVLTTTTASITFDNDQDKHFLTSFPSIDGTGKKISSILMCRFFRNSSSTADTYPGTVAMLSFDIHYEIDGFGSSQIFTK
jgi:hypothetical protein